MTNSNKLTREEIGILGFELRDNIRKDNSKIWDCICKNNNCNKIFSIKCQPKNWKHSNKFENKLAYSSTFNYEDLILFCSEKCKEESNTSKRND